MKILSSVMAASLAFAATASTVPVTYIMVCCHSHDKGTKFLANGEWDSKHDYEDYSFALDMMRKIKEAGIGVVGVDMTNPGQWDQYWPSYEKKLANVERAAGELGMQWFVFFGNPAAHTLKYWNDKAKFTWERYAQKPQYRRYGFGDDRPMATIFLPGKDVAGILQRAKPEEKNWIEKFRIGTCQVNDPIKPTQTDGWGYRNKSAGSTDLARFVAPNSGVHPRDWARIGADEWRERVKWALGAKEYAVIGTYDDTCDCIFWGIADVRESRSPRHIHETTKNNPYIYYNIVKEEVGRVKASEDRAFWVDTMLKIVSPVVTNLAAGTLRANLPRRDGNATIPYSELEAFGRVMTGFAPWFNLPDDDTDEGRLRAKWRPLLLKAIRNAADPKSPDFMVFAPGKPTLAHQSLVDAAFFAQGLLRSRNGLWERMDDDTRRMIVDALKSSRITEPGHCNWLLFAGEIEAFLLETTGECDMKRLRFGVDKFAHDWYVGEGYYSDGDHMAFDGYNSFVIHPMFYEIAEVMERHGIKDGAEYLALERKRLRRCADVQERMISPEGAYPMLGRSICYRFGTLQALALAATLGSDAHPASDGAVRGAMTAVLRRQSGAENFRPDGWLHVGFNGEQHCLAETYIGYGSVYLCTAFFLPLSLPADSPFWTAPEEPWTCKAGWGGADVRIDHAFWK